MIYAKAWNLYVILVELGVLMSRKGFTTIEMIIVVILIGVITTIAFPRLRDALEKQNVRSAKALFATLVATARSVAVQRGCTATLNMTVDSVWVTACGVNPPAASVQVGTKKLVGDEFSVTLNPSAASVVYDPRGLATVFQTTVLRVIGPHYQDSVVINQLGKVTRQ
jgi:prepilin-type N-terminal cleavage/methylation domain-containing protein